MKNLKKILSSLFPKGLFKENVKLIYYRFMVNKNIKFDFYKSSGYIIYRSDIKNMVIYTNEALYTVAEEFQFYCQFYKVKKGDYIIDAGANCGHLSVFYSKLVGVNGKVFAFEPDKYNISRIEKNFTLNKELNNVQIFEKLLWHKNELIDFCEAGTVGSSIHWISDSSLLVKKEAITLDSWAKDLQIEKIDFIKMDIEGAEIEALIGSVEIIKKFKPNFAIASYHFVDNEQTYIKLEMFFKNINYYYKTVKFNNSEIITFAKSEPF